MYEELKWLDLKWCHYNMQHVVIISFLNFSNKDEYWQHPFTLLRQILLNDSITQIMYRILLFSSGSWNAEIVFQPSVLPFFCCSINHSGAHGSVPPFLDSVRFYWMCIMPLVAMAVFIIEGLLVPGHQKLLLINMSILNKSFMW